MKRRKVESQLERQFLIAMIVSKPFLASASSVIDINLFRSEPLKQIAIWCIDYFKTYADAPGANIESIYHAWAEKQEPNETSVEAIGDFLSHLSGQYDRAGDLNVPYLLDTLGSYATHKGLEWVVNTVQGSLLQGDVQGALRAFNGFRPVNLGQGVGIDPLNDREVWVRTFADPAESIITFPGDAGKFLNRALTRDAFIGIQGPEKRGKTFWCVEFLMRALRSHKRVALFEVGDLSESQIMLRLGVRLCGLPLWTDQCGDQAIPIKIEKISDESDDEENLPVDIEYKIKRCDKTVSRRAVIRACRKFMRGCGIPSKKPYVMVSIHPNTSINVQGIETILERWLHERDFVPDVMIVDYADILAPEDPRKDVRHQINDTWKALRKLSQEKHCLVITPTQANAASYDVETQTMRNFSEDKRKLAHVTGYIGLNQTEREKVRGIMRLNWIVLREAPFSVPKCLWVAQCLPLGRAYCCATL